MSVTLNDDDGDDDDNDDDQRRGIGDDGDLASTTNSHPSPSCSILCNTHNTNHGFSKENGLALKILFRKIGPSKELHN
ncbi:hypothetical protein V1477_019804 [Vespula maculifrons]|uniref:Uncharacterized protein n=1 Tax=Vespula maculifrons TaxID=7453 RepID=A0ABD2ARG9_VESMC